MNQQLISPLVKHIKTEFIETSFIKEEIDIDWDEQNNIHEIEYDNVNKDSSIQKCNETALRKPSISKIKKKKTVIQESQDTKNCSICGKNFQSSRALKAHRMRCGIKPKFQCADCPFKTKQKSWLKSHIFRMHMEPVVISQIESFKIGNQLFSNCPNCKKVLKTKSYAYHKFYCGRKRHLQCAHCPYEAKRKNTLIIHIHRKHSENSITPSNEIHTNGIKRYCGNCDRNQEHHPSTNCQTCFSKLLFQCSKCKKAFANRQTANNHWMSRCGLSGYYHCYSCDYKGLRRYTVVAHLKKVHMDSKTNGVIRWKSLFGNTDNQVSSLYQCSNCGKPTGNAHNLKMHMKVCRDPEKKEISINDVSISDPTRCSKCQKKFEHVYLLNQHLKSCLKNQYATRITKDSDDEIIEVVEDHVPLALISVDEINKDIQKMAVKLCGKCGEESAFIENYRAFNQNKQCLKCKVGLEFKCKKCQKTFSSKNGIVSHVKTVCYPDDEFQCTKCDFKSANLHTVQKHYKSVHDTVSADCNICGKNFKNIQSLKLHQKKCGVEPKFQCEQCQFKTKRKDYLREHIFRKHMKSKVIGKVQSFKISYQRFSKTLTHLEAYCFGCKKEQSLHDRLKTCMRCKNKLHFKCKTCKKKFTADNENACDHVKAYLEMIKYECKRCGRGSMTKQSMATHRSRCGRLISCRFCQYVSNHKVSIKKHEKSKHPNRVGDSSVEYKYFG